MFMDRSFDSVKQALTSTYSMQHEIGRGGMAVVYLAQDLKHNRRVAIKILRPELAVAIGTERFLNEVRVTANLQHPNIVPLHDSGRVEDFVYFIMPYVEGESLANRPEFRPDVLLRAVAKGERCAKDQRITAACPGRTSYLESARRLS